MTKSEVLAILDEFKDRPIEIAINGAGDITVYGNMEGRWLFVKDNALVHVSKNTPNGKFDIAGASQREKPFSIMYINIDDIVYIKSYISIDTMDDDISSLEPVGTSKAQDDIIKEITSDSIIKSKSTVAPNSPFGTFRGSAVSTSIDGVDPYFKDLVNNN